MSRITICNIPVDTYTMRETIDKIDSSIIEGRSIHHVVVNAVKIANAQKDPQLKESIANCDIINPDGQSIIWAARFLNKYLPERVTGIDLMEALVDLSARKGYRVFLFGAKDEVVKKVVDMYSSKYNKNIVADFRNGYFKEAEEVQIAQQIADSGANILFVAISSPKKEIFLNTYKHIIHTPFIMGVGGSFDVIAGIVKRAPRWMQRWGLEWLYRTLQEPRRMWKRYLFGNSAFVFLVLKEKIRQIFKKN